MQKQRCRGKMNKTILILLILLLIPLGASAGENVSMEIFLNSMGEYYIGVDGGSLQPCLTGRCNVTMDRNITTSMNMTDEDIRRIARYTATELKGFTVTTDALNASETRDIVNDVGEKLFANHQTFEMQTVIPQQNEFNNLSVALALKKGEVNTLQQNANGYDTQIQALKSENELLKLKVDEYMFIIIVIFVVVGFLWIPQTQAFQEWKTKVRMK